MKNKRILQIYLCLTILALNSACHAQKPKETKDSKSNTAISVTMANNPTGQGDVKGRTPDFELNDKSLERAFFEQQMPEIWLEFVHSGKTLRVELPIEAKNLLEDLRMEAIRNYYYNEISCHPELQERHKRDELLGGKSSSTRIELQKVQITTPSGTRAIGYKESDDLAAFITKSVAETTEQAKKSEIVIMIAGNNRNLEFLCKISLKIY